MVSNHFRSYAGSPVNIRSQTLAYTIKLSETVPDIRKNRFKPTAYPKVPVLTQINDLCSKTHCSSTHIHPHPINVYILLPYYISMTDMQLTRFTDYGLRILVYVSALPEGEKVSLALLSEKLNMNHNHVNKVSQKLAALGWINSTRGKSGGICMAETARDLPLGTIVAKLEPQLEPIDCEGVECPLTRHCRLQGVLAQSIEAFMQVLMSYRLSDLTDQDMAVIRMLGEPVSVS